MPEPLVSVTLGLPVGRPQAGGGGREPYPSDLRIFDSSSLPWARAARQLDTRTSSSTLFQLHEDTVRARWMNECDQRSMRPRPGDFINQADAARLQSRKRCDDIVHAQRDVMQARAAASNVLRDWRFGIGGLEQFERRLTG